ncbi:hypothetical protein F441_12883 [Phytophthora nicotianae CJ01A1]|uniref:Uncharacterized protein n=1 Tax=Phytophthora nicotianae CJ01A1 TaxID=1317063 RepID=W2WM39_PHYNI|nr:hypothetical protein F441_12883 [Phytophthora nicotianae CJ01A1]
MNDEEIKNRNDWWLDCEESHTKDRTERAVESGRQKIQAAAAENGRRVDGQENAPSLAECVALSTDRHLHSGGLHRKLGRTKEANVHGGSSRK